MVARILSGLVGLFMGVMAVNWIVSPASAAEGLGMPFLDGMARSSQVGDFTSFFVCVSAFALLGAWQRSTSWVSASAALLVCAAAFRTLAWLLHGAEFATASIVAEIVMSTLLIYAAFAFRQSAQDNA